MACVHRACLSEWRAHDLRYAAPVATSRLRTRRCALPTRGSVFAYAIPAAPRPQLTHALTSHIYKAVGQGFYEDHGMP
eukprot:5878183-Prymnesium_polylepis.1